MRNNKDFTEKTYKALYKKDLNKYFEAYFPKLSKKRKNTRDKLLFNVENDVPVNVIKDKDFLLNGMAVFGINDTAFILAHGTINGKIALPIHRKGKTKHFSVSPQNLVKEFEELLPEKYKNIYTINCFGGRQNKFVTESGRTVQSLHMDKSTVVGTTSVKNGDKVFALLTAKEKIHPEIVKDIYKNVYNGKSVAESHKLKNIISAEDLKDVRIRLFNDFNSNKRKNTKPRQKKKTVQKLQVKSDTKTKQKAVQKPTSVESKPEIEQKPKSKPVSQTTKPNIKTESKAKVVQNKTTKVQPKSKIQQNQIIKKQLDIGKPQKPIANNNSKGNLKMKTTNYQELYEMNKNTNLPVRDKVMSTQQPKQKVVQPKTTAPKKTLLDINANKKNMAMMTDILQENIANQKIVQQTTAQIAKNICSSGNRYGKSAISIMSKIL